LSDGQDYAGENKQKTKITGAKYNSLPHYRVGGCKITEVGCHCVLQCFKLSANESVPCKDKIKQTV